MSTYDPPGADRDFCSGEFIDGVWDTCGCGCEDCVDTRRESEEG